MRRIISGRYGIGEFSYTHTLNELGAPSFWPDSQGRTRERARQVIKKGLERISNARISFSSFNRLKQALLEKPIWQEQQVGAQMDDLGIECEGPLLRILYLLDCFSGKRNLLIRPSLQPLLLTKPRISGRADERLVRKVFDDDLKQIRKKFEGRAFVPLDELRTLHRLWSWMKVVSKRCQFHYRFINQRPKKFLSQGNSIHLCRARPI